MNIDDSTSALPLPAADEWPVEQCPPPASDRQHLIDLAGDEFAVAVAAVEHLRANKAAKEAMRSRWQPVLDELAELDDDRDSDDDRTMAARLIECSKLCGWHSDEDDTWDERLTRLVVGIIEEAGWPVTVERHRGTPDRVRINGYRVGEE
jgi:hypothetical protein